MTPDFDDEADYDYDEGPTKVDDHRADARICFHCHRETAGESCGFCGNDLCPMCFEMGAGFCGATHTQEQIWAYEDEVYPPANWKEAEQRKRQRQAHKELKDLGIL